MEGGAKLATSSCNLSLLSIKLVEAPFVVASVEVVNLQIPFTPKPIPLTIPHIGVEIIVIMIDITIHAFEVHKTSKIVLRNTHVTKNQRLNQYLG
jgi:hypothetical protein